MTGQALISIIMPVYQTRDYLAEAVQSVRNQTYSRWELLLIDDGSTDGSDALCDQLAREDARIRVFHQENAGVSRARNKGLEEARGDYYCFLDSDDALAPVFLAWHMEKQKAITGGVSCCGFRELKEADVEPADFSEETGTIITPGDWIRETLLGRINMPVCCANWLIPARLAEGIRFNPSFRYSEDSLFLCTVLTRCSQLYCSTVPLYAYRKQRAGNTATIDGFRKYQETIPAWEEIKSLYEDGPEEVKQVLSKRLTELCCQAARRASQEKRKKDAAAYRKKAFAYWKQIDPNGAVPAGDRRRLLFYVCFPLWSEKIMLKRYGRV